MLIKDVVDILHSIAPPQFAEPDDQIGLQVGDAFSEVKTISIALDANKNTLQKAAISDLLILHHPVIYRPLTHINPSLPSGEAIFSAAKNNFAIFVMHTNYDCSMPGVSDYLAKYLEIEVKNILSPRGCEPAYKLVVFSPIDHTGGIIKALSETGAGVIGKYSACTFRTEGIGTFMPEIGSNPYTGNVGRFEETKEHRLEIIVPKQKLQATVERLKKVHPYEEPAYDIFEIEQSGNEYGLGRIGKINTCSVDELFEKVKRNLDSPDACVYGTLKKEVSTIAICGGAGGSLIPDAVSKCADVYITGDINYHQRLLAEHHGLTVIDAGHKETEMPAMKALASKLETLIENDGIKIQFIEER